MPTLPSTPPNYTDHISACTIAGDRSQPKKMVARINFGTSYMASKGMRMHRMQLLEKEGVQVCVTQQKFDIAKLDFSDFS